MRIQWVLAAAILVLASLACGGATAPVEGVDIAGDYSVSGVNLDGESYSGEATITSEGGNDYTIEWRIGADSYSGSLTVAGSAASGTWETGDGTGTVSYTIEDDGTLAGTWTLGGVEGVGTETLTPK